MAEAILRRDAKLAASARCRKGETPIRIGHALTDRRPLRRASCTLQNDRNADHRRPIGIAGPTDDGWLADLQRQLHAMGEGEIGH